MKACLFFFLFSFTPLVSVFWDQFSDVTSVSYSSFHLSSIPECSSIRSPKLKGRNPNRLPFLQTAASGRAPVSPHFCLPRWASCNPLRVSSSPGWHNSLKAPALWLQFYLKGRSSGTAKWRIRPGQSGGSSRIPSVCAILARHPTSTDLASVLKLGVRSLCVGALWLSRIDEFVDRMVEPSVLLSSPPGRMIWSRVPAF